MLTAVDPRHAVAFFRDHGWHGFAVLGAVFLVVTGGEALYADMGHFGKRPIRVAWFALVLPSLLLNYFGQGALLLTDPKAAEQPFFLLAPEWALLPLVVLATAAAIIASQALISGAFSLTRQAIQLGYCPRLDIDHTSSHEIGQVYVPQVNWALMICTIAIVIGFGSSTALAAAYGIAVTLTMVITALLLHVVATERWRWPPPLAFAVTGVFLTVDLAFFGANALKIAHGGWLPLVIGAFLFTLMTTWKTGRADRRAATHGARRAARGLHGARGRSRAGARARHGRLHDRAAARHAAGARSQSPLQQGAARARRHLDGHDAVGAPCGVDEQVTVRPLGHGVFDVVVRYGFMQDPNVPEALALARDKGLPLDDDDITYFLGRETLIVTPTPGMAMWREQLFALMARNAVRATAFFKLPTERVVEIGVQVEL